MDIAIIGIAGRFPHSPNVSAFYKNLCEGKDCVGVPSDSRQENLNIAMKSNKISGHLEEIDNFDHHFFGISPKEARYMDPHHRLLLEVVHETFENAGYNPEYFSNTNTCVFVSLPNPSYYHLFQEVLSDDESIVLGNLSGMSAGRISRFFNLTGHSALIDTTCSSSLVAVYHACNELITKNADAALVCGARLDIFLNDKKVEANNGIISSSGKAKPFSSEADGTIGGEAVACILLKPLDQAINDNDNIQAIIKGVAVNQDAQRSSYMTAPSSIAQKEVIQKAWEKAGVDPSSITYIEAHGTGTKLGDPIEVQGIELAFKDYTSNKRFCALSSVKSNIGHTDNMAGLTSLIKTVIALKYKKLFPSLHCQETNPFIDFEESPVYVNKELKEWILSDKDSIRRAGVSSFAMSGTNCHAILEEYITPISIEESISDLTTEKETYLLKFSAKTEKSFNSYLNSLTDFLSQNKEVSLNDLVYTLNHGRSDFLYKQAVTFNTYDELVNALQKKYENFTTSIDREPVFLFSDHLVISDELINQLSSRYSIFKSIATNYYNQINFLSNDQKNIARIFIFQYGLFSFLKSKGIKAQSLLGVGIGDLTVKVLLKKISPEEVIGKIKSNEVKSSGDLKEKLTSFLDIQKNKRLLFIEMGNAGSLSRVLTDLKNDFDNINVVEFQEHNTGDSFLAFIANLYNENVPIDWNQFHLNNKCNKIELPTYVFEKSRFWVKNNSKALLHTNSSKKEVHQINFDNPEHFHWTEVQKQVANIWYYVLEVKNIGLDDDFFSIGGHSLNGIKIINKLEEEFFLRLEFEDLFEYSSVRKISDLIANKAIVNIDHSFEEIEKIQEQDFYEISAYQRRMWILSQFSDISEAYNLNSDLFLIKEDLDVALFEKSFQHIVERHESLRTTFFMKDEICYQEITAPEEASFIMNYHDLRLENDAYAKACQLGNDHTKFKFDLKKCQMLSVMLVRYNDKEYLCQFCMPHIISDGWSEAIIMGELRTVYKSLRDKKSIDLSPLKIQYKDYSAWQKKQLTGEKFNTHKEYWMRKMAGNLPVLDLPIYQSRPAIQTYNGKYLRFDIPLELRNDIYEFSKANQITAYMFFVSVLNVVFYKYTGLNDIILGSSLTGRNHKDLENQVGFYVNTIPLRTTFDPKKSFAELISKVKETVLEAFEHQVYPFDLIVEGLELKRDISRSPIFDVLVDFINYRKNSNHLSVAKDGDHLKIYKIPSEVQTTIYDINFEFLEDAEKLSLHIRFNTDLFKEEQIDTLYRHFEKLSKECINDYLKPIYQHDILLDSEKELLNKFNATDQYIDHNLTILDYLDKNSLLYSDKTALIFNDKKLSYHYLNEQVNKLAYSLITEKGIKPGSFVGVLMERTDKMVISILAIWKCGAAYVPIDVKHPLDRVRIIVEDSCCTHIICLQRNDKSLLEMTLNNTFLLESISQVVYLSELDIYDYVNSEDIYPQIDPRDLAYAIYTSGSTGKPKGAMVEHIGMMNHLQAKITDLKMDAYSIVAQNASYCFDISVWQFFASFMVGGTTIIYEDQLILDPDTFIGKVEQDQVTILEVVPSYLSLIYHLIEKNNYNKYFDSLKFLMVTGEALQYQLVKQWFNMYPSIPLVNAYGPTEASDDITHHFMHELPDSKIIPIGKVLQNLRIYIVDDFMQLSPIGIKGEILVSGLGVGKGYINDKERTDKVFMSDPFRKEHGIRLYKTGDVGRFLKDGTIEFFGRKDNQIKVNGHRIELEEIENILADHSFVKEVAVVDKKGVNGNSYLSSYIVADVALSMQEIRNFLSKKIPNYMIPSYIHIIDKLPLTSNGKLDRNKLRILDDIVVDDKSIFKGIKPSNDIENKLYAIWTEVLNVDNISIDNDFFDLGGDSFKAIRIASKFGPGLMVLDIYKNPTIESLALHINSSVSDSGYLHLLTQRSIVEKTVSVIGIPNSAGDPITYQKVAEELDHLMDNINFYGVLQPRNEPDLDETLKTILESMVVEIVREIKIKITTPIILYGQCNGSALALQLAWALEQEGINVIGVCMGAQLAPMQYLPEVDNRSDDALMSFMKRMGSTFPKDIPEQIITFRNWRYDTMLAGTAYNDLIKKIKNKKLNRLKTQLFCIVGTKDPLTTGFENSYHDWEFYSEQVALIVMQDVGHYLARDKANELANILLKIANSTASEISVSYKKSFKYKVKSLVNDIKILNV